MFMWGDVEMKDWYVIMAYDSLAIHIIVGWCEWSAC